MTILKNETVQRFDFARLDAIEKTPSGGLRIPAALTRTGVLTYKFADGTVRKELRSPVEVFKADSLKSLRDAPVTDLHPPEMVTPDNHGRYSRGHVSDLAQHKDGHVNAVLAVQDRELIQKIDRKDRQEVSCGYRCDLQFTPGEFNGEKYDAIQTNIKYNHVALGPSNWGRAGSTVALRLDSCDAFSEPIEQGQELRTQVDMKTIRLDDKDFEFGSEAHIAHIDAKCAAAVSRADGAQGRVDGLQTKLTKAEADLVVANDPKRIDALVAARVTLETDARKVLGPDVKFDGKTQREIMLAVLKLDEAAVQGRSDDYLLGRFETAVAAGPTARTDARSVSNALRVAGDGNAPAGTAPAEGTVVKLDASDSYKKMRQENQKAGMAPLPGAVAK